ncbi:Crp/Fnr family transcriptional regulator [Methylobacterium sp. CM6247]
MPFGTRPLNPLIHKIESFVRLSDAERTLLQEIGTSGRNVEPRKALIEEGEEPPGAFLILEGSAYCYKQRKNGRRQITALIIPGDLGNLNAPLLRRMNYSIGTFSACRVVWLTPETMEQLQQHQNIAHGLRMSALVEKAMLHEWLLNVGGRTSIQRLAHLLCELYLRYQTVGWARGQSYELPLKQADLADLTGISNVHVNRTLQELRRRRLIELKNRRLSILDWAGLKALAEFDAKYLHLREGRNGSASDDLPLRLSSAEPDNRFAFESGGFTSVRLKRSGSRLHNPLLKPSDASP